MKNLILIFFLLTIILILFPALTVVIPLNSNFTLYAQTEEQCEEQLSKAEEEYQLGNWTEAIELIEQCLKKPNVAESEKGKAYRLLGLVYIAIQLEKEAKDAIKNLLLMAPDYKINLDHDPPHFQKLIQEISNSLIPKIDIINPNKLPLNETGVKLKVNGSNFSYGSKVQFDGNERLTDYINSEN